MGMGYGGTFAVVLKDGFVQEICPKEYQDLIDILDKKSLSLDDLCKGIQDRDYVGDDDDNEPMLRSLNVYDNLVKSFCEKTKLEVSLKYHDSKNDGDRYDEVEGVYWEVEFESAYQRTPAAEKYQDKMSIKSFVIFG